MMDESFYLFRIQGMERNHCPRLNRQIRKKTWSGWPLVCDMRDQTSARVHLASMTTFCFLPEPFLWLTNAGPGFNPPNDPVAGWNKLQVGRSPWTIPDSAPHSTVKFRSPPVPSWLCITTEVHRHLNLAVLIHHCYEPDVGDKMQLWPVRVIQFYDFAVMKRLGRRTDFNFPPLG